MIPSYFYAAWLYLAAQLPLATQKGHVSTQESNFATLPTNKGTTTRNTFVILQSEGFPVENSLSTVTRDLKVWMVANFNFNSWKEVEES